MDNVENCVSYINTPSSQTYRSYSANLLFSEYVDWIIADADGISQY
jgi:hypothetical protein